MKRMKTLIALISLFAFVQGTWAQENDAAESEIEGLQVDEETGEYIISSPTELITLAEYVNEGNDCTGLVFNVTADINFKDTDTFTPIGQGNGEEEGSTPFCGTFNGNGKTISGIKYSQNDGVGVGLFGYLRYPAVVKDVKLKNSSFTGNYMVGGIAGSYFDYPTEAINVISNCEVGSDVTVNVVSCTIEGQTLEGLFAGGIVGDLGVVTIANCISAAKVSGDDYVGGIAGSISHGGSYYGTLVDCFYTGNSGDITAQGTYKGDLVGLNGLLNESDNLVPDSEGKIKLTLFDNDKEAAIKNTERLSYYDGITADITISGRTLYKDGNWNTLWVPFSTENLTGTFEGAEVRQIKNSEVKKVEGKNKLSINFEKIEKIEGARPFLVKWNSGDNISNPVFEGITISKAVENATTTYVDFCSIVTPFDIAKEDKTILFMGDDNKLYYPNAAMTINAFRGYFKLKNIKLDDVSETTDGSNIDLNLDEDSDGIRSLVNTIDNSADVWYDLNGRQLNGQPVVKGLYIRNGKKVVLK